MKNRRWRRQRRRAAIIGALPGLGARAAPVAPLPAFTPTPEGIDASVATDEKDVIDASVSTDTKDVIDASVSTDTKEVCDVFVETDAKENLQDFQQQTDVEDAKIKLKEFLNVMKDLSISDLTGVISRAAQAINDKSLL